MHTRALPRRFLLAPLTTLLSVLGAQGADETIRFEPLPANSPAVTIAVSEDGAWLFSAHESANEVVVWSVATGERESVIETESPRALLHRKGKLYVGSFGEGHVRAFSEKDDWDLDNEFELTGKPKVYHLSAPRGKAFADVLLVNAVNDKGGVGFLLDVRRDRHQTAILEQAAYVDADGKNVGLFGNNGYGPGKTTYSQPYSELLAGKGHSPTRSKDHCHFLPGYDGTYWFGSGRVWSGQPPQPVKDEDQGTVIPDVRRNLYYSLKEGVCTARLLYGALPEVGRMAYEFPSAFQNGSLVYDEGALRFYEPVAVTAGDRLLVYVLDSKSQQIFRGEAPAFKVISIAPGRPLEHTLAGGDAGSYELVSGPGGLTLSPDGILSWTPARKDVGVHSVKFKLKRGGRSAIEQQTVQVASEPRVAAASRRTSPAAAPAEAADAPSPAPAAAERRIWVDRSGQFRIQAEYLGLSGANVQLRRDDGRVVEVPLDRLSDPDQQWVREAGGAWTTVAADQEGFRVDFPGKPERSQKDQDGNDTIGYSLELAESNAFYAVMLIRMGEEIAALDRRTLLEMTVSNFEDDLVSKKLIQLDEHMGMEALLKMEQNGAPVELTIRIFGVKGDLYQVMAGCPPEIKDAAQITRFLDSFRLLAPAASPRRTWTDATGKFSIEAELVRVAGDQVILRRENGAQTQVPLARLSAADQAHVRSLAAPAGASAPSAAAPAGDEAELDRFQGVWRKKSHRFIGEEREDLDDLWKIEGRRLLQGDDLTGAMEISLNLQANPKQIDLGGFHGIYKLEGSTLTVCYGPSMFGRPKEFASPEGELYHLIVLERIQAGPPAAQAPKIDYAAGLKELQGAWKMVSRRSYGEYGEPKRDLDTWYIKEGLIWEGKDAPGARDIAVDATHNPKHVNIGFTPGIYKIEGDTLTMCLCPADDRPTEFTKDAPGHILMVFKRTAWDKPD